MTISSAVQLDQQARLATGVGAGSAGPLIIRLAGRRPTGSLVTRLRPDVMSRPDAG
jgi:hypothetical protein